MKTFAEYMQLQVLPRLQIMEIMSFSESPIEFLKLLFINSFKIQHN